jgi:hypothetical protein
MYAVHASAALALLAAAPCHALEWSYSPGLRLAAGYDTNQHMAYDDPQAVRSTTLNAGAELVGRDEGFSLRFAPRINAIAYDSDEELDRDDIYADVGVTTHRDHGNWSLTASHAQDGTLTGETETTELFGRDVDRSQSSLSTSWTRSGARGAFDIGAAATEVNYDEQNVPTPYVDYTNQSLRAGYSRVTSERSTWRFGVTRFRVDNAIASRTLSTDVRLTWSHVFSESLRGNFGLGAFQASVDGRESDAEATPAADFSLTYRWRRWGFSAGGGRELMPEGRGTLQREDSVRLGMTRRLTQRFDIGADWSAVRVASIGTPNDFDYDYLQSRVSLQWRFKRRWTLDGAFYGRAQRLSTRPEVTGVVSQVSVSYRGLQ